MAGLLRITLTLKIDNFGITTADEIMSDTVADLECMDGIEVVAKQAERLGDVEDAIPGEEVLAESEEETYDNREIDLSKVCTCHAPETPKCQVHLRQP